MRDIMRLFVSFVSVCIICVLGMCAQNAAAAPCPDISFVPPVYFPGGVNTNALATGDINGDGKVDLVAANEGSGNVMVRFGNGSGAFPTALQLFVTTPSSIAVADFNGDGHVDIATTSRSNNRLTVWLNLGGGAFGPPVQTTVGSSPSGIAMGDLNGDGRTDLVTSNGGSSTITFLPGNGAGAFPTATSVSIARGSGAFGIVTADFNGDGKRDVATANRGSANISVLIGNGIGGFAAAVLYPAGSEPNNIATGDFNGDGKPDLVTANLASNNLTVRINNGLGAFPTAVTLSAGAQPGFVSIADLDDDGHADIVAANQASNNLSAFRGGGNGTFAAPINFAVNAPLRALAVADLNGNGKVDIAAGVASSNIAVLLNACVTNTAPTISTGVVTRQQDAGVSNSSVATVNDGEQDLDELEVTVNGGASSTLNGVTVSNIAVDAAGNVTADVVASCGASDALFTLTVTDNEGLSATAMLGVDVTNETTPPVINDGKPIPDISIYLLPNSPDLSMPVNFDLPMAVDNCSASPTVSASPASGSTFNVGSTIVTVTAEDDLDNTATATFRVNVLFNFGGFLPPVDPFPMLNIATAGSAVPVKFSLSGDKGLNILASGYPASSPVACNANEPGSTVEETTSVGGGLSYDAGSDRYKYVWKTDKAWRSTCRIFILKLADGSEHYARFSFR